MTGGAGVLLALVLVTLIQLPRVDVGEGRRSHKTLPQPHDLRFVTSQICEGCSVSSWSLLGQYQVGGNKINIARVLTSRCRPARRALWQILLGLALSGQVHLNPGPHNTQKLCQQCDRPGRRNQIKIACNTCNSIYHTKCLQLPAKQIKAFRAGNKYTCWSCALPNFSDSFIDLDPAPLPPTPAARQQQRNSTQPRLLAFNARSLTNRKRRADTLAAIENSEADIICVTETWLSADHGDHEIIPDDFVVFRNDRKNCKRASGGSLIAVRPHLQPRRLKNLECDAEVVWVETKMGDLKVLVGSAYRKPNAPKAYNDKLIDSLDKVSEVKHLFDACVLTGDFNLDADWSQNPPRAGEAPAAEFLCTFSEMAFTQMVNFPTRTTATTSKILDLALCDVPTLIASAKVVPGTSDHDAVQLDFAVQHRVPTRVRESFDFKRVDWAALSDRLAEKLNSVTFVGMPIDYAWEKWLQVYWQTLAELVPKKRARPSKQNCAAWMTPELRAQMKQRDRLFAKWQKRKTQLARAEFVAARKQTQKALRLARDKWMWELGCGPGGNKFFWAYVKSKSKISPAASVFRVNGENVSEPERVASAFGEVFSRNFNPVTDYFPFIPRRPPGPPPPVLCDMSVSAAGVYSKLQQIKGNTGPGPDGVQGVVLKSCAAALAPSLSRLFNCSLQQGALAQGWKTADVVAVPKGGDKSDMENYRPISMTSLVGKTLEKLVRDKVQTFIEENKIIPDCQHGFRAKRSCTTHLGGTLDRWASILDEKSGARVHAITLDWKKAFDRVPHDRLLSKLSYYGIRGSLLRWAESFLKGRTQRAVYNGAKSEVTNVLSGVIQGSVLGPLFFIIYIADLRAKKSQITLYADDVVMDKIISEKNAPADMQDLQDDLSGVETWGAVNGMELNASKCHVLELTRARRPFNRAAYTVGGTVLEYSATERILGVHVSSDLRWNAHIDIARGKAAKVLSFAARNLHGCTPRVKRLAYQTMVKPLMFYGTPAWHPSTEVNKTKLERVHKRALRFVYGRHIPEQNKTQLLNVDQQLRYNDLTFFRKCLDGDTDMDATARITTGRTMRNANGEHRLIPPKVRTDLGIHSFSFRLATQWNSLPSELKSCPASHFPKMCRTYVMSV